MISAQTGSEILKGLLTGNDNRKYSFSSGIELCHRKTLSINQLLVGWKLGEESLCELHIVRTRLLIVIQLYPVIQFRQWFWISNLALVSYNSEWNRFFHLDELLRLRWFRKTSFGTDFVHGNFVNFQLFIYAKSSLSAILTWHKMSFSAEMSKMAIGRYEKYTIKIIANIIR